MINPEHINKIEIIIVMIINTILIFVYNFQNYIYIKCSNKNYTFNDSEAILGTQIKKRLRILLSLLELRNYLIFVLPYYKMYH